MTRRQRIEDLTALAVPEQPALSPDGTRIVYVLRTGDTAADRDVRSLWEVGTQEGEARQLTRGSDDTSPAWSPDGSRIAFLRESQLWLLAAEGGEPERLTDLPLGAGAPVWSPDGSKIAFSAPVDLYAEPGEDAAARAKRATAPMVIDRLDHHADGAGELGTLRQHLHVADPGTGEVRQFTNGDWHAGPPAWSPDSTKLAFAAGIADDRDLVIRIPVHVVDVTAETPTPRQVALGDGFAGPVLWTADGAELIVVGGLGNPTGPASLLRVPLDGGAPVNLTESLDRNVMPGGPAYPGAFPQLTDDGRTVLFCARDRGCTHLYSVPVAGGEPAPLLTGAGRTVSGLSVAGGTAAVVLSTPASYGEIVGLDLATGTETVHTRHGDELGDVELFSREEREFTISDGTVVQGWVIRDPSLEGPAPLLLDVHGGPHNAWNATADEIHFYHQELAARGWTILLLNPRGSDGYGSKFFNALRGAWGTADCNDFLEPIDQLVAEGIADPARLAVAGYSYGGFMAAYLTGHDDRFAAAVAGGVCADFVGMAGTAEDGHFISAYEFGALPWENPDLYTEMSPYARVGQVNTPTLVVHGTADLTCPVGQALQWHSALRARGVPTRLVLYPEASHAFILQGKLSHRIDFNQRVLDWLERYAGSGHAKIDAAHWQRRLNVLAERHHVPGATLGILRLHPGREDEVIEAAYGVLNTETGAPVTTDSVFQIGSISKVWTTTVAMQLVDEGLLDLDAPIADVLPELRLSDPDVTKQVTMRHLLTHTSGIDGDVFTDTGRGDDCLEKYTALLADIEQNHPIGVTWSYCNSGFVLAGRVIEKITGQTWDEAMRARLFTPLGLTRTGTLPEEALLFSAATGHTGTTEPAKAPVWTLPRSLGPAGLITSTVADVLEFARMHLSDGDAGDTRVLSEESAKAMTAYQTELPDKHTLGDSWGLGWFRLDWDGHRLVGHDGNTIGQAAFLRLLPDAGLAVTLLTNGGNPRELYEDLYHEIFAEVAGVAMPHPLAPADGPVDADITPHLGVYERAGMRTEIFEGEHGPKIRTTVTGPLVDMVPDPVEEHELFPVRENLYVTRENENGNWIPVTFYTLPTGEPYVHYGVRANPKAS